VDDPAKIGKIGSRIGEKRRLPLPEERCSQKTSRLWWASLLLFSNKPNLTEQTAQPMPKLIVRHPEKGEMTFPITGDRVSVGRRGDNAIQINHGTISGHHAELVAVNGHYVLRDLDSTNHCFVDGFQVSEADLSDRCKLVIGTVECEFIPDDTAPSEVENLRKTVSLLREQNEELVGKLNDQQKQIDILGSARLLTPATGADLISLREQVKDLTKENQTLRAEVERLRTIAARAPEPGTANASMKATTPVNPDAAVAVAPDGEKAQAPPKAKAIVDPTPETATKLEELLTKARPLVTKLVKKPKDVEARAELASVAEGMVTAGNALGQHAVARLLESLQALVRDVAQRHGPIEATVAGTLEDTVELLGKLFTPEMLKRVTGLNTPNVLAVDSDNDMLPAIVAGLEFGRFQTVGTNEADKAMTLLKEKSFDLILLGVTLPGATAQDARAPLRDLANCAKVPVISLTSEGAPPPEGVDDWLSKPVNMFDLTLKAHAWVLKHQLELN
jgi:pSer/pThr/pTyr-binding forkhead associated (FHA) protein/CheY-like chemotaxis protein